jgi:putative ABC transport system permease protein
MLFNKFGGNIVVRTSPGKTTATIQALAKISQELNPAYPFKFLGIFISCLGLYGLSAFMAEQRTKEIGVRKVLGASVLNLVYLLSSGITRLVLGVAWLTVSYESVKAATANPVKSLSTE